MRRCDPKQLTMKPFAAGQTILAVAEDGEPREVALGGLGMLENKPVLTLFLTTPWHPLPRDMTVNLLPPGRRLDPQGTMPHLEPGQMVQAARVAEAQLAFECRVMGTAATEGFDSYPQILFVEVLAAYQRWPRGCAIT